MSCAALVIVAAGVTIGWIALDRLIPPAPSPLPPVAEDEIPPDTGAVRHRNGFGEPSLLIQPVAVEGDAAPPLDPVRLHGRLVDVLSRFEGVRVLMPRTATTIGAGVPLPAPDYVLGTAIETGRPDGPVLRLRLVETAGTAVLWQASYPVAPSEDGPGPAGDRLMRKIAAALLQPYGLLPATERGRGEQARPSPYRCTLEVAEFARFVDPIARERTRRCLVRAIAADPAFGYGRAMLARMYWRQYLLHGFESDLATAAALAARGVALAPHSARAHYALMTVRVSQGRLTEGLAAGSRALTLNPYDFRVLTVYGAQLTTLGRFDEGYALLQQARESVPVMPLPLAWGLFFAAYAKGDLATAENCVAAMEGEFDLNHLARGLLAVARGDMAAARAARAALRAGRSIWDGDPRRRLRRFIPSPVLYDRIVTDFARIPR
ncbi:hypothetical protein A33M_1774 [Rhodovulum sp. PH10]|nr:hypothetical protein A33M_1774 [Rhodovulum sp. PH10]